MFNIFFVPFNVGTNVSFARFAISRTLLVFNAIFISYFWLNGVKDFVYVIWYYAFKFKLLARYKILQSVDASQFDEKVLMVYCTCNDFDGQSLQKCMRQTHKNTRTVILDDSSDESFKDQINKFAKKWNVKVVRRKDRTGFKAGNINNYVLSNQCELDGGFDFVVILDSDEIIPPNFVSECLKYFHLSNKIGVVQASHISTRNRNFFMKLFHIGVNSHWPTYQTMKQFYGFSTMLGHGAMIKRQCLQQIGGFPALVAEDLCLSIELRGKGFFVCFAPNIVCEEEYPIDYVAFKKGY